MNRLTKRTENGIIIVDHEDNSTLKMESATSAIEKAVEKLAAYEDTGLEPEGVLIIKQLLANASKYENAACDPETGIKLTSPERIAELLKNVQLGLITYHNTLEVMQDFEKTAFMTREQAEAALAAMKEGATP